MTHRQPDKSTKILYIVTQGEMGGAQRYVFDLATNLLSNFEIVVAMGDEKTDLGKKLRSKGVKVIYLKHLVRNVHPVKEILALLEIKTLIKTEKPKVVHLNSTKAGFIGSLASRLAGHKNVVFTAHGFAFLEPKPWIVRKAYFWAEKFASQFRKKIITITNLDKAEAIKSRLAEPNKFVTVFNGIRQFEVLPRSQARQQLNLTDEDLVVGTIAHDYKTKDLPTLKKAVESVKQQLPNLKLVIIGKGSEYGEISNAKRMLSAFDVYASSSTKEGHPYTILEAAFAGLPIVATKVGGIPDTLEDQKSAVLVTPKNPKALAEGIKKLLEDEELAEKLGREAKVQVQKFSLKAAIDKTVTVYNEVLKQ